MELMKNLGRGLAYTCVVTATVSFLGVASAEQPEKQRVKTFESKTATVSYPAMVWKTPSAKMVAAVPLTNPDDKPDGVAPTHEKISFTSPELTIYVVSLTEKGATPESFKKKYPTVVDAASALKPMLTDATTPATKKDTPVFPWVDASTPFEARKKLLKLKNGKAVRFVAEYLIEPDVVDNSRLVYSAQGLTDDGKYYISVVAPLKTKSLPDKSDISKWPKEKYQKFSDGFAAYSKQVGAKLDKLPEQSFSPSLESIDRLVQNLLLKPASSTAK